MSELDSVVGVLLQNIAEMNLTPLHLLQPDQAREGMKLMIPDSVPTPVFSVENRFGDTDETPCDLRIYRPSGEDSLPCVLFYHGGGWVVCDLDTHDEVCRQIASKAGCVVVSVDYRLAPEHKFPAAINDAYSALLWVDQHADALGIDRDKIAVAGDSAGGNLAAVVCLMARDNRGPKIHHQSLWYPVTDISALATPSYAEFAEGYRLEKTGMQWFKDHYLDCTEDAYSAHVSPLLCDDLSGLPTAYVMTAGFDVLRDEGQAYAEKLRAYGNDVVYECFDSLIHGFMNMGAMVPAAQSAVDRVSATLKTQFDQKPSS